MAEESDRIRIELEEFQKIVSKAKNEFVLNLYKAGDVIYSYGYGHKLLKLEILQILPPEQTRGIGYQLLALCKTYDMEYSGISEGISLINLRDGYYFKDEETLKKALRFKERVKFLEKEVQEFQSSLYTPVYNVESDLYKKYEVYSKYDY